MSTIRDVPSALGQYIARGWILTDEECKNPLCKNPTILLKAPKGEPPQMLCVSCMDDETASNSSQHSNSTPPTDMSSRPRSPPYVPPPISPEMLARRAQSDAASREIGQRMLKGWAMLGDECPSPTCYGIPLVRRPKSQNDPKKECVACGTVYLDGEDGSGRKMLEPVPKKEKAKTAAEATSVLSSSLPSDVKSGPASLKPLPTYIPGPTPSPLLSPSKTLEATLSALSTKLEAVRIAPNPTIDHEAVGSIAASMSKVAEAMLLMRQLGM